MSRPPQAIQTTELIRLSPDELAAAPHQVLVSLVERYQDDLERHSIDAQATQEELRSAEDARTRLEKELGTARKRVDELLSEQGRLDDELSGRVEVVDKLRAAVRELEHEKKEATKRYREQAETHESARQAWHDQEQHLKNRIATLATSPRKLPRPPHGPPASADYDVLHETKGIDTTVLLDHATSASREIAAAAPAPSPAARTCSPTDPAIPSAAELALIEELTSLTNAHESLEANIRMLQTEMSDLKRVYQDLQEKNESYEILLGERTLSGQVRDTHLFQSSVAWTGESPAKGSRLEAVGERDEEDGANGPLDLAAELGASHAYDAEAANGGLLCANDRTLEHEKAQRALEGGNSPLHSVEDLRQEVRTLKDANKALTLYVSKIVDRVCQQEGFEKVLAVDYRLPTTEPSPPRPDKRPRPASISFFGRQAPAISPLSSNGLPEPLTPSAANKSSGLLDSVTAVFGFSRSATAASPTPAANMKPLVLAETARKLEPADDVEDEDDRRERARIHAEMQQLGFSPSRGSPEEDRCSGFTEAPPKRMSLLAQRRVSAISSSELSLPVGLGISADGDGVDPVRVTHSSAPPSHSPPAETPAIRKALRRLSTAFSSPAVSSA